VSRPSFQGLPARLVVDTHCWLWISAEPERFSFRASLILRDPRVELLVSAVVAWEIAIKVQIGKLDLPEPPAEYMARRLERHGATELAVEHAHALRVGELPLHHRDPFDRLLVAQAQLLGAPLLTADQALAAYDVDILWADLERGAGLVSEPPGPEYGSGSSQQNP